MRCYRQNTHHEANTMTSTREACFVGAGIGSLATNAFSIRDGGMPGGQIAILEADLVFPCGVFDLCGADGGAPVARHHRVGSTGEATRKVAPYAM
jgi:myosin-crossreactive antigen